MKGFVASWFFPPSTSAEGLVTFKLIKYSKHNYDVCYSLSNKWCYDSKSELLATNINCFPVETDNIEEWVKQAIYIFESHHKEEPYDFVMTRSMPPESIEIGNIIKKKYPGVKWVASFGDPIANNPYQTYECLCNDRWISDRFLSKMKINNALKCIKILENIPIGKYKKIRYDNKLERLAFRYADTLIFPSIEQCNFSFASRAIDRIKEKAAIIPHSYDSEMYSKVNEYNSINKKIFTYIGHMDKIRSGELLLHALCYIRVNFEEELEGVCFRFIGNIPQDIIDLVHNFQLEQYVIFNTSVDYLTSIKIMQQSDWLIHIDANFKFIPENSVFFASKLVDYLGCNLPILGFTSKNSVAGKIIINSNGVVIDSQNIREVAEDLIKLFKDSGSHINECFSNLYNAINVAKKFDGLIGDETNV